MSNFCRSCGAQLAADAKFCAACGATAGAAASPPPAPAAPQYAAPPAPPPYYPPPAKPNIWPWIAGVLALLIVVAGAVYFAMREPEAEATADADSTAVPPAGSAITPPAAGTAVVPSAAPVGPRVTLYVVSDANVRNQPTATGNSAVLATLRRGTQVSGNMQIGANGKARWFKLADNSGYISAINLGESLAAPPVVAPPAASVPGAIYCTVVDRTGSSLRVRSAPNGQVVGGMPHGVRLRVLGEQMDEAGVNWVRVDPDGRYPTGWVSGSHISC